MLFPGIGSWDSKATVGMVLLMIGQKDREDDGPNVPPAWKEAQKSSGTHWILGPFGIDEYNSKHHSKFGFLTRVRVSGRARFLRITLVDIGEAVPSALLASLLRNGSRLVRLLDRLHLVSCHRRFR